MKITDLRTRNSTLNDLPDLSKKWSKLRKKNQIKNTEKNVQHSIVALFFLTFAEDALKLL